MTIISITMYKSKTRDVFRLFIMSMSVLACVGKTSLILSLVSEEFAEEVSKCSTSRLVQLKLLKVNTEQIISFFKH